MPRVTLRNGQRFYGLCNDAVASVRQEGKDMYGTKSSFQWIIPARSANLTDVGRIPNQVALVASRIEAWPPEPDAQNRRRLGAASKTQASPSLGPERLTEALTTGA